MTVSPEIRFIQLLPNARIDGNFILKDLPGSGKRIDLLCRTLSACFDWGPAIFPRSKLEVIAILQDKVSLQFKNPVQLPKGEVGWATQIQSVLKGERVEHIQRIDIGMKGVFEKFHLTRESTWVLREDGKPIKQNKKLGLKAQNSFMVGDHIGFDEKTSRIIESFGIEPISLGQTSYLSSHCVAAVISEFERRLDI